MHIMPFAVWIAGYWPVSDFWLIFKAWLGIITKFLDVFYADHVRFDLCHPYKEYLATGTLMQTMGSDYNFTEGFKGTCGCMSKTT